MDIVKLIGLICEKSGYIAEEKDELFHLLLNRHLNKFILELDKDGEFDLLKKVSEVFKSAQNAEGYITALGKFNELATYNFTPTQIDNATQAAIKYMFSETMPRLVEKQILTPEELHDIIEKSLEF